MTTRDPAPGGLGKLASPRAGARIARHPKRWLAALLLLALALAGGYPAFVLLYTWSHVARVDFEGGRHGPLDAYRHALASAVVAYTLDEKVVALVSRVMEFQDGATHRMDRHNNHVGASIGSRADSFFELEPLVRARVLSGKVNARAEDQLSWLPASRWLDGKMW